MGFASVKGGFHWCFRAVLVARIAILKCLGSSKSRSFSDSYSTSRSHICITAVFKISAVFCTFRLMPGTRKTVFKVNWLLSGYFLIHYFNSSFWDIGMVEMDNVMGKNKKKKEFFLLIKSGFSKGIYLYMIFI